MPILYIKYIKNEEALQINSSQFQMIAHFLCARCVCVYDFRYLIKSKQLFFKEKRKKTNKPNQQCNTDAILQFSQC